ncbi:MAG: hypothetical protein ACHQ6U_09535 [Thermodesulfobacteriota bacterium]
MRNVLVKFIPLILFSLIPFLPKKALAQLDSWEFEVYPYMTEGPGSLEFELLNGFVAKGHNQPGEGISSGIYPSQSMLLNSLEITYGLTDHIEAAVYLDLALPEDQSYQYTGSKYRLRGRLFEKGELPIDLGWYAELEWHRTPQFDDNKLEFELRPIMEKDLGRFTVDVEPKFEKTLSGADQGKGVELGYVAGLYYRWLPKLSPGLEFYGGSGFIGNLEPLNEQQQYAFAVLWGKDLPGGIKYNCGLGAGLTSGSDRVIVKCNIEFEKFVGRLF